MARWEEAQDDEKGRDCLASFHTRPPSERSKIPGTFGSIFTELTGRFTSVSDRRTPGRSGPILWPMASCRHN